MPAMTKPSHVLVLITPPEPWHGLGESVRKIMAAAPDMHWAPPRMLGPGIACEIPIKPPGRETAEVVQRLIVTALKGHPVDACVIPVANRRKKLLIADMDSTIIQQECIDEMADVLGVKPRIAAITERAMRGELPFEDALRQRLSLLAGISELQLQAVYDQRIKLMPGAKTLVATMAANGATTALVSGGFTFFTSRVAKAVGFAANHANTLEVADGRLTGRVVGAILGREAKLATLQEYAQRHGLTPDDTLAVGDGANDLDMIKAAGLGVAYRAKPIVAAEAHAGITHGDLTALLYLQGYRKDEFVVV